MAIDMSQFHQVFFDETTEHLSAMESLLLAINVANPESEELHAIFRAAHSIKGGAATFGFSDMAELTHVLESLLDRIRKGSMALTVKMIDLFLRSKDLLYGMLAAHKNGAVFDNTKVVVNKRELEALANTAQPVASSAISAVSKVERLLTVYLELDALEGVNIEALLESLAEHGDLSIVQQGEVADHLPWVVVFTSLLSPDEVAESLAFTLEPGQFRINVDQSLPGREESRVQALATASDSELVPEDVQSSRQEALGIAFEEDGFGLFEPLPSTQGLEPVVVEDEVKREAPAVEIDSVVEQEDRTINSNRNDKVPAAVESSIRVSIEKVDLLLNLVGELVITQSMLLQSSSCLDPVEHERLLNGVGALQRNSRELQDAVMSIRMMPIAFVFNRFPRVVHDLASKLGKQVELKMVGENTELDKGFIEKLADPLTHLVRNCLGHGIEAPEVRRAKGKSPNGRLTLRAFHQGGSIVIEVCDDGAGLNRERILTTARERGLPVHDNMADSEVWALIFDAGFSTASEVTDVSGRGVGMDVVKRNIEGMGGRVEIDSMADIGTTMSIRLPLTLAIMDGMSVRIGHEVYVLPLGFILESMQALPQEVKSVAGCGQVVNIRGEYLPIISLAQFFTITEAKQTAAEGILIIVEAAETRVALLVDELIGQQQFVVKNLETHYRKVDGISGATILGDGQVALILDISTIVRQQQRLSHALMVQTAPIAE
ncbi:chemotaxis protein CheW [Neisseriaceae bacterium TC5R-5]|nr:chemotaxis protein CheW [Neisseriaceae bacterium TC5R-5]